MPVFELQTDDGRKFQVNAPSAQDATAALHEHTGRTPTAGESFRHGMVEGIPVLGPMIEGGAQRAASYLASKITGKPYDKILAKNQQAASAMESEHPVAETAGEVLGGIGSTGALGATDAGATLLGLTGKTLPQLVARGAASGAGINAADAAVRGDNPLVAAGVGGAVGGAAPVAGRLLSAVTGPARSILRGIYDPNGEAQRRVATALDRDIKAGSTGLSPQEFAAAKKGGQPVNLMDVGGETTRGVARSAANTSPEGRQILNQALNTRYESQSDRLTDWLRSTFHYPDAIGQQEALETASRSANKAAYDKAYQEGSQGLWSPELERLSGSDAVAAAMQRAVKSAKDEAIVSGHGAMNPNITFTPDGRIQFTKGPKGVPTYPDLQFWDLTRRELSDAAQRAGPGTSEARRLQTFAKSLNNELDKMVPSYAKARAGAAAFFGARDALEAGQQAVTSKMTNSQIRSGLDKMSPQEKQLFQDGFVDRYVQMIRDLPDRRTILNRIAQSPGARERLALAVGPQRAAELEVMLRVEGVMDMARSAVQGNSTTARQLVELGLAGGVDLYQGGGQFTADPQALMNAALVYGAARGQRVIDERVAQEVARLLTSSDVKQLQKGLQMVAGNKNILGAIRNADAALASVVGRSGAAPISRKFTEAPNPATPFSGDMSTDLDRLSQ